MRREGGRMILWRMPMGVAVTAMAVAMVSCQARTEDRSPPADGQTLGIEQSQAPKEGVGPLAREQRSPM